MIDRPRSLAFGAATMGLLLAWLLLVLGNLVVPWVVVGRSMEPGLQHGDRLLVDIWSYRTRPPRDGEVALFRGPGGLPMVKRIAVRPPSGRDAHVLWVLGDNPRDSRDSREFGPVAVDRFRGRVCWRYWPLSRLGPVRSLPGARRPGFMPAGR